MLSSKSQFTGLARLDALIIVMQQDKKDVCKGLSMYHVSMSLRSFKIQYPTEYMFQVMWCTVQGNLLQLLAWWIWKSTHLMFKNADWMLRVSLTVTKSFCTITKRPTKLYPFKTILTFPTFHCWVTNRQKKLQKLRLEATNDCWSPCTSREILSVTCTSEAKNWSH